MVENVISYPNVGVPAASSHRDRHRRRTRRHQSRRDTTKAYKKSVTQFSATHIVVGFISVIFQMVQFTNQTILSDAQPGLWCGVFFVLTGSVCLLLFQSRSIHSILGMVSFCLVSLFMALTLSSMSWIGMEATSYCEYMWDYCFSSNRSLPLNITDGTPSHFATMQWAFRFSGKILLSNSTDDNNDAEICDELANHKCGFNILLGKTMHSLLVLTGVLASTTSFILATITCGGARHDFYTPDERRTRLSVIFDHNADDAAIARPITPWEYPPPSKEPLSFAEFPSDPPPLYQERESDISSNL